MNGPASARPSRPEARPSANGASGDDRSTVAVFRKDLLPGSETFIRAQVDAYRRWRPVLVGYRRCPGLDLTGAEVVAFERDSHKLRDRIALKIWQHGQYWGLCSRRLCQVVDRLKPRIIHAHYGYDAVLVYDIAKRLGVPLVVTFHGMDITFTPSIWKAGAEGYFFRRYPDKLAVMFRDPAVHFLTVSDALRATALERGAPADRTHVFYTGIDCRYFAPDGPAMGSRTNVLFVGRLVEIKGCEYLVRAMEIVQRGRPDATLVVVGDGPLRGKLETMAARNGVAARFAGSVPPHAVRAELAQARVLCLPSITDSNQSFETFGMVILEAQACGVPVATSARGGREGIVDGTTGYSFREGDYEGLASRIATLLADDMLCERMSAASVANARHKFDIQACTAKLEAFYDRLLEESDAPPRP